MKHMIPKTLPLLMAAFFILCCTVPALAAEATPASGTVDALHNGEPPVMPGTPPASTPQVTVPPPPTFQTPEQGITYEPETEQTPEAETDDPALYPSDVQGVIENDARWIIKTYELGAGEAPEGIGRESFVLDGWNYELTDILKNETAVAETREHTETVTVNSETKEMTEIMALLTPERNYSSEDGRAGTLALDVSSIKVEQAGTKTSAYTVSATREYPHLSANDTSLIPKTVTDKGMTLTLAGVDWQAQNTVAVDYDALPDGYTATATYTATGYSTKVTGYTVTAEYKGTIAKLAAGKTLYTAHFIGTQLEPPAPESAPEPESTDFINPIPVAAAFAGAVLLGSVLYFFLLRKNVSVHNLRDGKYAPIGKARVSAGKPIINLTPFADRAASGSFILVLGALASRSLSGKTVTVNYGDRSFQHIINGNGGEYQFEVDF